MHEQFDLISLVLWRLSFRCFLLIQANIEKARLPISDYVNDTKTVMDSVPRLLAAMQFIACNEFRASGSFEVVCQIVRTKQLIATRTTVSAGSNGHGTINQYVDTNVNVQLYANLLCEALSIHDDAASIISKNRFDESKGYSIEHVLQSMRRLSRDDAAK